ncbi:MAG: hypothetical protein ACK40G_13020 [Cytophagaceae bacterium]
MEKLNVIFRLLRIRTRKTDMNSIINDNLDQIKQIRLNRMKFYRSYKKSMGS